MFDITKEIVCKNSSQNLKSIFQLRMDMCDDFNIELFVNWLSSEGQRIARDDFTECDKSILYKISSNQTNNADFFCILLPTLLNTYIKIKLIFYKYCICSVWFHFEWHRVLTWFRKIKETHLIKRDNLQKDSRSLRRVVAYKRKLRII